MEAWEHPDARVDNLVVMASRGEVETGDISGALRSLEKLLDPKSARKLKGCLIFGVRGYEDDPRDLWEIPDVRAWMQELDKQFPYWFYFMDLGQNSTLAFVAFSLCKFANVPSGKHIPPQELQQFLISHFGAMNGLTKKLGETQEENDKRSREVTDFFFSDRGKTPPKSNR